MPKNTITIQEWSQQVENLMLRRFGMSPCDYDYDSHTPTNLMVNSYNAGESPEVFCEYQESKYDLVRLDLKTYM